MARSYINGCFSASSAHAQPSGEARSNNQRPSDERSARTANQSIATKEAMKNVRRCLQTSMFGCGYRVSGRSGTSLLTIAQMSHKLRHQPASRKGPTEGSLNNNHNSGADRVFFFNLNFMSG